MNIQKVSHIRIAVVVLLLPLLIFIGTVYNHSNGIVLAQAEPDAADKISPSTPSGLSLIRKSAYSASFSWNAASDSGGSGLAGYDIYRNGVLIGSSSSINLKDTGLSQNTNYAYYVVAYDGDDNISAQSSTLNVMTNVLGDLNGDARINAVDLSLVLSRYKQSGPAVESSDVDGNGAVNAVDLSLVLSKYGYSR